MFHIRKEKRSTTKTSYWRRLSHLCGRSFVKIWFFWLDIWMQMWLMSVCYFVFIVFLISKTLWILFIFLDPQILLAKHFEKSGMPLLFVLWWGRWLSFFFFFFVCPPFVLGFLSSMIYFYSSKKKKKKDLIEKMWFNRRSKLLLLKTIFWV